MTAPGPATRLPLWRRLVRAFILFAAASVLAVALGRFGPVHAIEPLVIDGLAALAPQVTSTEVVAVEITDEDYERVFGGRSPLDPDNLSELITKISRQGPPVAIGVDINTRDAVFRDMPLDPSWVPIVWSREVINDEPQDVLGGRDVSKSTGHSGIPRVLQDEGDGVERAYTRLVKTAIDPQPSFTWVMFQRKSPAEAEAICVAPAKTRACLGPRLIDFRWSHANAPCKKVTALQVWTERVANDCGSNPFSKKLVILGGSYRRQDRHLTPLGEMSGWELLANTIEAEVATGGRVSSYPPRAAIYLFEIFEVIGLTLLFHLLPFRWAVVASLVLGLAVVACFVLLAYPANILILFAGIMVFIVLVEITVHFRHTLVIRAYDALGTNASPPH